MEERAIVKEITTIEIICRVCNAPYSVIRFYDDGKGIFSRIKINFKQEPPYCPYCGNKADGSE